MTKWIITYFDGFNWINIPNTKFEGITEELNAHEEASFSIPNNAVNREFVLHDYPIKIFYDSIEVYSGLLQLVKYTMTSLTVTVYNQVYNVLQKRKFTGVFNNVSAATVLGAITGLGSGGSSGVSTQNFGCLVIESAVQHVGIEAKDAVKVKMLNVDGGSLIDIFGAVMVAFSACKVKMAVYSDVAGVPTTLLGVSDEVTLTATEITWTQFHFSTPITLAANIDVWFAIQSDGEIYYALAWIGPNNVAFNYSAVYADGFTDPFGTINWTYTRVSASFYGVLNIPGSGGGGTGGGECPTTAITTKYVDANSYDAAVGISKVLNKDFWGDTHFNIGVRNSCVMCLPFDDGAGYTVTDVSGNGNDGAIYPVAGNYTFGRSSIGDTDLACSANTKYASKFTAGAAGYLSKLTMYIKLSSPGTCMLAIYADSAGAPGALITVTLSVHVGTGYSWVDFPFFGLAQPSVVNGTVYWLAILVAGASCTLKCQSAIGNVYYNSTSQIDPFGTPTITAGLELCIYASAYLPFPQWVTGKYGKALSFPSNVANYVSVPNSLSLQITGDLTLACWVYFNSVATVQTLIRKNESNEYMLSANTVTANLAFYHAGISFASPNNVLSAGIWTHIAVVRSISALTVTFYVNGVQVGTPQAFVGIPTTSTSPVVLGENSGYFPLNGNLDEVMIFNRALPAEEILFHYNNVARNSSTRTVDRSKINSSVIVNGTDLSGYPIVGAAGTGSDVHVLTQIEASDQATINKFAATALVKLSNQDTGSPVNLPISAAAYLHPGDTLPLRISQLDINSNYRIQKIVKITAAASITLQKPVITIENVLTQMQNSISQIQQSSSGDAPGALGSYSYLISKDPAFATNGLYNAKTENGTVAGSSTNAVTVIQNVYNAAPVRSTVECVGDIDLTGTLTLNREVNFIFNTLNLTVDVDGLVITNSVYGVLTARHVYGDLITFPSSYTHACVTLAATIEHLTNVDLYIHRITSTGSRATGASAGILLLADEIGVFYNKIRFDLIGLISSGIKLDATAHSTSFVNCNIFNGGGGWIYNCDICVNIVNEGGDIGQNIFKDFWVDGSGGLGLGIHNEGKQTQFSNVNEMDFFGGQTRLYNAAGATAFLYDCVIDPAYITNLGLLVTDLEQLPSVTSTAKTLNTNYQNLSGQKLLVYVTLDIAGNAAASANAAVVNIGAASPPTTQITTITNTTIQQQIVMVFVVPTYWYYTVASWGTVSVAAWFEQTI